jgi:hypothetical protein
MRKKTRKLPILALLIALAAAILIALPQRPSAPQSLYVTETTLNALNVWDEQTPNEEFGRKTAYATDDALWQDDFVRVEDRR